MRTRLCLLALALATPALAQWSGDPAANLTVADRSGDQVQPKIRATPDGGCFISWFDNSAGGYDVSLQRLNAAGVEQWAHNGVLIADRSVSSTVDYDLVVDGAGNALITYNDDTVVPGTQQIQAQKVSPAGALLWGPRGVTVSDGVTSVIPPPHACRLSGGGFAVGWTLNNVLMFQKLDAAGVPQWSPPVSVSESGHYLALSDVQPDESGGFIALWVRGTTTSPTTSAKALYAQRFDGSGAAQWNGGSPVIVFNTTSIQNGYFPTFIADGSGGAVFAWYETGGSRNSYLQHVGADGTPVFAAPVASTGATPGRIRLGASVAYDAAAREYYIASEEGTSVSTVSDSVVAQKIDQNGMRLWGDQGMYAMPITPGSQPSFARCHLAGASAGGCLVFCITPSGSASGVIAAARVDGGGTVAWSRLASSTPNTRARLNSALSTQGFAMLAWGNGSSGPDIQAQNVNPDGTLGYHAPCYADCDGSATLNVNDFICFQSRFAAQDAYADCDHSSALNVNDFVCFQGSFAAGCR